MKFVVISDTHFEFYGVDSLTLKVDSPQNTTLILAGDINVGLAAIKRTVEHYCNQFANVVWVSGNHDNYNLLIGEVNEYLKALPLENFHVLDMDIVEIEGVKIGGATMWGIMTDPRVLADMGQIEGLTADIAAELHMEHKAWVIENAAKVDIMVTHFCPSPILGNPKFPISKLTPYFTPTVMEMCEKLPPYWAFGHTHYSIETEERGCLFISNQVGYPAELDTKYSAHPKVYECF